MEDLVELLDRPEQQILTLLTTSSSSSSSSSSKLSGSKSGSKSNSSSSEVADETRSQLIQYAQSLFRDIETLGTHYHALGTKQKNKQNTQNDDDGDDNNDAVEETQTIQVRPGVLSGLAEMYVPASNDDNNTMIDDSDDDDEDNNKNIDDDDDDNDNNNNSDMIETIFGQVELQNDALKRLMKSSIKKLSSTAAAAAAASSSSSSEEKESRSGNNGKKNMIRVLDMDQMNDEDEEQEDDDEEGGEDDASDDEDVVSDQDEDEEEEEDEDARRIRERMERAMEDMEDIDDDEDMKDEAVKEKKKQKKQKNDDSSEDDDDDDESEEQEEDLYDPVAEDLKDGFFDLNEMEAFADEEEEFLPDEAFGQPQNQEEEDGDGGGKTKKKKETKSFHQRQRDGDLNDESDDDEDDGDDDAAMDDMYEEVKPVRRKKYRDQEDIDALYNLYQDPSSTGMELDDDDDNDVDVDGMTASDYFGGPKKKYIERYRKNHPPESSQNDNSNQPTGTKNGGGGGGDDDDDSWGEYDFEQEDQAGWQDQDSDEDGDDNDQDEDEDQDSDEDDDDDEQDEPMNDEDGRKTQGRAGKKNERKLSKHEAKLQRQTEDFEKELLSEKPWQMRGETKSTSRPVNSLLESTPEFEMASKQAPTITVQHTASLEDIIKRRILAEDWDDVVPRELPDVGWHKKRGEVPEVSQEKSKLGLGELYEREYLKKAVGYDVDAVEKQTEEDKAKDEMKQLFANICSKLDALSNYHFAPRPVADEAEVRTVTQPAIAMEEVLPLHVSDARGVAPEEVFATKRGRDGVLRSETEMDQSERKRQRQSKKAARRKARKEKLADEKLISRLQPGLGLNNPYEKRKAREELALARSRGKVVGGQQEMDTKFGSSGTFFKRLQAEAQQTVHGKGAADVSADQASNSKPKSSAFKL